MDADAAAGPPAAPPTAEGDCATPEHALKSDDEDEDDEEDDCKALLRNAAAGPPAAPPTAEDDCATQATQAKAIRKLTAKEMLARKRNARNAGVKTPEGKAVSRLNARKHGVFATALTALDRRELRSIHHDFKASAEPVGALEEALVEKMSLCWLRIQRCARAEAELHQDVWLPTVRELWNREDGVADPYRRPPEDGPATFFKPHVFERLVRLVHRYDTSLTNQFVRLMHELERLQRRRTGDAVEPPVSADVSVTGT